MPALKPRETANNSLAAILAHPLRARVLGLLSERTASPRQIATAFRKPLHKVNYQVKTLEKLGFVEPVGERPVRGAVEHFYRAIARPHVRAEEYATMDVDERNEFAEHVCQLAFTDAAAALSTKRFSSRPNNAVARIPVVLDEEGWEEAAKLHDELVERMLDIQADSDQRRADSGEDGVHAESLVLLYERESLTDWCIDS